jgi:ribonuclease E
LKRDLDYLTSAWESFSKRLKNGHGPAPLYQESDIAIRTVRDLFSSETEAVIVDDVEVHRQILEFTRRLMPEAEERVKLHDAPKPLFQTYGIEPDFERLFARRIELPSGGSTVFDQAEALVAIDVNSGRTRGGGGHDFEEIALKTNLEAAPEIARQIRLRDLGGILVIDFIDMMKQANIRKVEKAFADALAMDRARSKIGRISQFGLLELTRQRLGPGISRKVFTTCPRCRGTGRTRTIESRAAAVLRRLGSALTLKGFAAVEVKAHPEVIAYLKRSCTEILRALEYRFERQIQLVESIEQQEDSVLRYLRNDGREVRPGGRRKR